MGTGIAAALHRHLCTVTGALQTLLTRWKGYFSITSSATLQGGCSGCPCALEPSPASAEFPAPSQVSVGRLGWHLGGLFCWDLGERGGQRLYPAWHPPREGREGPGWAQEQEVQLCLPVCRVCTSELASDTFVASWHFPSSRCHQQALA